MRTDRLADANAAALSARPFLQSGYRFRPASTRDPEFHALKRAHPYFGYIDVEIEGVAPFVMFSNNDDRVAQTYFWYGADAFESLSLRMWRDLARQSGTIFDIGAFTGLYGLCAATVNRDARVVAFEPIKGVFGRLIANLVVNRLGQRVEAHALAVGSERTWTVMHLYQGHRTLSSGSSLVAKPGKRVVGREHVDVLPLDAFVADHQVVAVDLVKVDVEMAEREVVAGMVGIAGRFRPHVLVEVASRENLAALRSMLAPHGYSFAVIDDLAEQAVVDDEEALNRVQNVLFTPWPMGQLRRFCDRFKPLRGRRSSEQ